jgi:hypothetical protein
MAYKLEICIQTQFTAQGKYGNEWPIGLIRPTEGREDTSFLVAIEILNSKRHQRLFRGDTLLNIYRKQLETPLIIDLKVNPNTFEAT